MKIKNYILLFSICSLASCVNEFVPESNSSEQRLVAIAEIAAGELSTIHLSSTFGINTPEVELDHDISVIKILNIEEDNRPEEYRYNPQTQQYQNQTFIPREGALYALSVDANIEDIPVIFASTKIPFSTSFEVLNEPKMQIVINNDGTEVGEFDAIIEIEDKPEADFFHFIPYIDDTNKLRVETIEIGGNAINMLNHRDGILIDKTRLGVDNRLAFNMRTTTTPEVSGSDPSYLYFQLRTITQEYYDYHIALSKQSATNAGPYTLPVTTYTNVENGYGLFASYSSQIDSILIQ